MKEEIGELLLWTELMKNDGKKKKIRGSWIMKAFALFMYAPINTKQGGVIIRCKEKKDGKDITQEKLK